MQRVVSVAEPGVERLGQLAHVRRAELAGQREDGGADTAEGRSVHRLAEVDLAGAADAEHGVEPALVRLDGVLVRLQADDLTAVGVGGALEIVLGLKGLLLGGDDALGGLEGSEVLKALEVRPIAEHDRAKQERLVGVGTSGLPFVDHLEQRAVAGFGHRVSLGFVAPGQAAALDVGAAPAVAEVGVHLLGEQEEQLFVHLRRRSEDALDVGVAVGFGVAIGQVEGVDDLALVARGDAGLAEDLHHAGEAVDITLHHHRGDRDAGVLGEAVATAEFLRQLRIMRLSPREQEILGQRHARGGVAAGQLDDAVRGELEVGADDDRAGEAGVEAVTEVGRKRGVPLAGGGEQQHLLGIDLARAVTDDAAAARRAGLPAEGVLDLGHPGFGHQDEDLLPRLGAGVGILRDEVGEDRLGAQVLDALRGGRMRLVLDLAGKPADDLQRRVRLGLHQVGEGAAQHRGRDLRQHAEHLAGGLALLPVVDLLLGTEDGDVVVPDTRDLVALGELRGLLGREESGDLLTQGFVGDLVQVRAVGKIGLGEVAESAREEHAAGGETTRRILAAELLGAAREALGDPEALVGRNDLTEHLAELAELAVVELAGHGVRQGEHILEAHAALRTFREIGQHLVVDAAGEVARHPGELGADVAPVAEAEGGEEARIGGRARVRLGRFLHRREDLGQVAGITMAKQALIGLLGLGVERRRCRLLGG